MKEYHPRITKSFVDRCDTAAYWEAYVAGLLSRLGLDVIHPALTIAGPDDKLEDFYGSSDLVVGYALDSGMDLDGAAIGFNAVASVEVKSSTKTLAENQKYDRTLVCSQNAWKRKFGDGITGVPKKYAFVFISSDGHTRVLPPESTVGVRRVFDKSRCEVYQCMDCDSKDLITLEEWVEQIRGKKKPKAKRGTKNG